MGIDNQDKPNPVKGTKIIDQEEAAKAIFRRLKQISQSHRDHHRKKSSTTAASSSAEVEGVFHLAPVPLRRKRSSIAKNQHVSDQSLVSSSSSYAAAASSPYSSSATAASSTSKKSSTPRDYDPRNTETQPYPLAKRSRKLPPKNKPQNPSPLKNSYTSNPQKPATTQQAPISFIHHEKGREPYGLPGESFDEFKRRSAKIKKDDQKRHEYLMKKHSGSAPNTPASFSVQSSTKGKLRSSKPILYDLADQIRKQKEQEKTTTGKPSQTTAKIINQEDKMREK